MARTNPKVVAWYKRKIRVRKKIAGRSDRPRLTVYRSLKNIYAQIIDDEKGSTLVETSTLSCNAGELKSSYKGNVVSAKVVGKKIAEVALAKGIVTVVFDRNGYLYHGRVKALAEAARQAGLIF